MGKRRPFGQKEPKVGLSLKGTLRGDAYKVSLFLPIMRKGRPVFSEKDEMELRRLFNEDFDGVTTFRHATHPLVHGEWKNPTTKKIEEDEHNRFDILTLQVDTPLINYFNELRKRLLKHINRHLPKKKKEKDILIEKISVRLI